MTPPVNLLDFLDRIQQIQAGAAPSLPPQETYSESDTEPEELGDVELLLVIQELDGPPSVSRNDKIELNDPIPINGDSSTHEEAIEKELIQLKHSPRKLFQVAKKYLLDEEKRAKHLALSSLSTAVDEPVTKWDSGRRIHLESRMDRSEAATLIARGHHTGVGLERDDERALHYYKLAKGKLTSSKNKTNIVGTNCFEAASFLKKIAVERKEPDLLLKSIKWFKQSLSAKHSPSKKGLSEIADSFWLLSQIEASSLEERIKYNLKSYTYCLRALKIDLSTSSERIITKKIKEIKTTQLDSSASHALVTLGHLFHHGYYENEKRDEQTKTNPSLSLLCYKKAFEAGHHSVILEAIDISGFIQESSMELIPKREVQALLSTLKEIRDRASPEEVQKVKTLFKEAKEKFHSKWGACTDASSSISHSKRQRKN